MSLCDSVFTLQLGTLLIELALWPLVLLVVQSHRHYSVVRRWPFCFGASPWLWVSLSPWDSSRGMRCVLSSWQGWAGTMQPVEQADLLGRRADYPGCQGWLWIIWVWLHWGIWHEEQGLQEKHWKVGLVLASFQVPIRFLTPRKLGYIHGDNKSIDMVASWARSWLASSELVVCRTAGCHCALDFNLRVQAAAWCSCSHLHPTSRELIRHR